MGLKVQVEPYPTGIFLKRHFLKLVIVGIS